MNTVKRWKIKEHYVSGEFAGYVIVTDDKYDRLRKTLNLLGTKADFCAVECDWFRERMKDIETQININFFSDCNRQEKCFTMQRIREIVAEALGASDK